MVIITIVNIIAKKNDTMMMCKNKLTIETCFSQDIFQTVGRLYYSDSYEFLKEGK